MIMQSRRVVVKELTNGAKRCHYCQGEVEEVAKHHVYLENSGNGRFKRIELCLTCAEKDIEMYINILKRQLEKVREVLREKDVIQV